MGISDLHIRNVSLMLRWWWKCHVREMDASIWTSLIIQIRGQGVQQGGPRIWMKSDSFFWGQLLSIRHIFIWSTEWSIGDGTMISFWFDNWEETPLVDQGARMPLPAISLREATDRYHLTNLNFRDATDELRWRWTTTGLYSAKSVYSMMCSAGRVNWHFNKIWKLCIPPTVRVFIFLLLKGKILTRDVMLRRHFQCKPNCVLCDNNQDEFALHLLFTCSYAQRVWHKVSAITGINMLDVKDSIQETWMASAAFIRTQQTKKRR